MKSTKFENTDFIKKFKYFMIAPLALMLVGLILFFAVGFNKDIDFTGGTIVDVYVGDTLKNEEVYNQSEQKINQVLSDNGLKASVYQTVENNLGLCISVRYQDASGKTDEQMNEINNKVVSDLYEKFGYDQQDSVESGYIKGNQKFDGAVGKSLVVSIFSAIVVGSLAVTIYMLIRFGVTTAMSTLLCVFADILVMLSMALICRLQVNTAFIASILAVACVSYVNNILFFEKIRQQLKLEKIDNRVVANQTIKNHFKNSAIINSAVIGLLAVFVIFGFITVPQLVSFALPVIIGVVSSFYTSNLLAPALWAFAFVKKDRVKKDKQEKITL